MVLVKMIGWLFLRGHSITTFNEFVHVDENLITAQLQKIGNITDEINGDDKHEEMNDDE